MVPFSCMSLSGLHQMYLHHWNDLYGRLLISNQPDDTLFDYKLYTYYILLVPSKEMTRVTSCINPAENEYFIPKVT